MKMGTVVIRKYGNRRLYDTASSRYVNLDEIAALVRDGHEVKVVDAKSGQDLTRVTLTQIIVENVKDQPAGLPLELLRQLILASDRVRQEFLTWYLQSAFDGFEKVQHTLTQVGSAALAPMETVKRFLQGDEAVELKQLRQRVAQLEARLQTTASPPASGVPQRTPRRATRTKLPKR